MPATPSPRRRPGGVPGTGLAAGTGLALLMVLCCAAPALIAAGALTGTGAWLSSPPVITAGAVLAIAAITTAVLRHRSRRPSRCPPASRAHGDIPAPAEPAQLTAHPAFPPDADPPAGTTQS